MIIKALNHKELFTLMGYWLEMMALNLIYSWLKTSSM